MQARPPPGIVVLETPPPVCRPEGCLPGVLPGCAAAAMASLPVSSRQRVR